MIKNYNCYIHIPFCRSKCKYCRFASFSVLDNLKIEKYVDFLCREIELVYSNQYLVSSNQYLVSSEQQIFKKELTIGKKNLITEKPQLDTIYFGGGTPSILSEKQLKKILKFLKKDYNFAENIEITMETTPEEISLEKLKYWQKLGINRISIGFQSLNKKTLETIGRSKKSINIEEKFIIIEQFLNRLVSFEASLIISVDFIIGLPFVGFGETLKNIKYLTQKYEFINHISVYMLEDYYSFGEKNEKFERITYPKNWQENSISPNEIGKEYLEIKNFLEKKGFFRYELSNFGKKDFECKHNKGYWKHKETLAFGLGASGFLGNFRYKNSDDFLEYYTGKNIQIEKLSKNDIFLEKLIFSLRTSGISEKEKQKLNLEKIDYFLENGYLEEKEKNIILSDNGVLYLDYILGEII